MTGVASRVIKAGLVLLGVSVFLSSLLPSITANVPLIVSLRQDPNDTYTLIITVFHEEPSPEHYVDRIQFSVDNRTENCPGSDFFSLPPQQGEEFTFRHSCLTPCHLMLPETPRDRDVKVRARCTVHGWSEWSDTVEIIEFDPLMLLGAVVALAVVALATKKAFSYRPD